MSQLAWLTPDLQRADPRARSTVTETVQRPRLLLLLAPYRYPHKNGVAATLAWIADVVESRFDVYYDAIHFGRHYGSGNPNDPGLYGRHTGLGLLTGGLLGGGRHLEAVAQAIQRFEARVFCVGEVAFSPSLASLGEASGAQVHRVNDGDLAHLYEMVFDALGLAWPRTGVMVNRRPTEELDGIDSYTYPEVYHRRALGIEASASAKELRSLRDHGLQQLLTCGVGSEQQAALTELGFEVVDLDLVRPGDDYAAVTRRLALRWKDRQRGWIVGDPTLVAYWLPTACREHRAAIYSVPQSQVIASLRSEIANDAEIPILGRQFGDGDFFTLSSLGQSFQVVDPCRPPLPNAQMSLSSWPAMLPDPRSGDPTDEELRAYAREGRVLSSLVFWTGMIRETENLYALTDLVALTGLRAGFVLTAQSLSWRPSPLDLLFIPREQGGVFPGVEILLGSCGTGVAIESLLTGAQLRRHLAHAFEQLEQLGVPAAWRPQGWWATMDAPLVPVGSQRAARRIRWKSSAPYRVQIRFHRSERSALGSLEPNPAAPEGRGWRRRIGDAVRGGRLEGLFEAYRPYENFEPGPIRPDLAEAVRDAGFSYMLSKSGFGPRSRVLYEANDFVALNYTTGQWDGWTPFETVNDVKDLQRAEKTLLKRREPGWLLGTIDSCLWTFSGELWHAAPRLYAIAEHVATGGDSGRLVNVAPRVIARYARLLNASGQYNGAHEGRHA